MIKLKKKKSHYTGCTEKKEEASAATLLRVRRGAGLTLHDAGPQVRSLGEGTEETAVVDVPLQLEVQEVPGHTGEQLKVLREQSKVIDLSSPLNIFRPVTVNAALGVSTRVRQQSRC